MKLNQKKARALLVRCGFAEMRLPRLGRVIFACNAGAAHALRIEHLEGGIYVVSAVGA